MQPPTASQRKKSTAVSQAAPHNSLAMASDTEPILRGVIHRSDTAVGRLEEEAIKAGATLYKPEQKAPEEQWPPLLLKETAPIKERWDLVICLLIAYSAIIVPYRLCFDAEAKGALFVLEAGMSLVFMCDLVLSFNTAYLVGGEWVSSREQIARRYLSGWFWIDAPSSLPVELIELCLPSSANDARALSAFRILRMLRMVRMLRLLKLATVVARLEEELEVSLRPIRVLELVLQMLFFAHLLACAFVSDDDLRLIGLARMTRLAACA